MSANLENSAVATGLENLSFHSNPKEGQCQRIFTRQLCSFCMLVRLCLKSFKLDYTNQELPDVQIGFRKDRETRDQIAKIHWIIAKAREFQKNNYFYFTDYTKAFGCVDHNKLQKILKDMGIPDHLTCLLRNLSPEKPVCRSRSNS